MLSGQVPSLIPGALGKVCGVPTAQVTTQEFRGEGLVMRAVTSQCVCSLVGVGVPVWRRWVTEGAPVGVGLVLVGWLSLLPVPCPEPISPPRPSTVMFCPTLGTEQRSQPAMDRDLRNWESQ